MNKKIKLFLGLILGVIVLFSLFSVATVALATTVSLTADSLNVNYGGSTYLRWSSTDATSCVGTNFNTNNLTSGSFYTGTLTNTTTYNINCSDSNGSASDSVTVVVNSPIPQTPSITIYANPIFVSYGNSSVIYWSSINATSCYASGGWSGNKATSGNKSTGSLFSNTTFGITCNNSSGSTTDSITVSVAPQSVSNPTVSLTADSLNVNYGGSTYLRWSSTDATSCVGTNFNTNNLTSGSFYTGTLTNTTTYNINCSDSNGSASDSVTVVVNSPIPQTPSITIYANPIFVSYGNSSVIYWSSINATSCYASGGWSGNKATSGNQSTGSLFSNTTFGITCNNSSGSTTDSITVSVAPQSVSNPTVSLTADSLNVNYGGSTYLRWSSTDATSCVGTNFNTNNLTSGSFYTGTLTNTTTYNINCSDSNGSASDSVTVVVNSPIPQTPSITI